LRSFGKYITDEDIMAKRALAEQLRNDPERFARVKAEAAARLATMPAMAKGVKADQRNAKSWWMGAAVVGAGALAGWLIRRR
jgi:3-deoxy-D-arabino-heptulosonate 7-phosphate (DAHP) synthase class II